MSHLLRDVDVASFELTKVLDVHLGFELGHIMNNSRLIVLEEVNKGRALFAGKKLLSEMLKLENILFFVEGLHKLGDFSKGLSADDVPDGMMLFLGNLLFQLFGIDHLQYRGDPVCYPGCNIVS